MNIRVVLDECELFGVNVETYNELQRALKNRQESIVTNQLSAFSVTNVLKGYTVIAWNGKTKEMVCLNDLLDSGEVRVSQNAEKMLVCGCFGLIEPDEIDEE